MGFCSDSDSYKLETALNRLNTFIDYFDDIDNYDENNVSDIRDEEGDYDSDKEYEDTKLKLEVKYKKRKI